MTPQNDVDVAVSLKIPADLVAAVDARIRELDLNRSQYFRRLARQDLAAEALGRASGSRRTVARVKEAA